MFRFMPIQHKCIRRVWFRLYTHTPGGYEHCFPSLGVTGRVLDPIPATYGRRLRTPLKELIAGPRGGLLKGSLAVLWRFLASSPATSTPSKCDWGCECLDQNTGHASSFYQGWIDPFLEVNYHQTKQHLKTPHSLWLGATGPSIDVGGLCWCWWGPNSSRGVQMSGSNSLGSCVFLVPAHFPPSGPVLVVFAVPGSAYRLVWPQWPLGEWKNINHL